MNADQELRGLKRGLKVLALLNHTENVSITELAKYLGLPRTTAERVLLTLVSEGYVQRVPQDKKYRLSAKICELAAGFSDDCWIVQTATPQLFRVTEQIGWPLAIATPSGDSMVLRATTDPATSLWLNRRRVGSEVSMLNSSSGLVAYAFATDLEKDMMRHMLAHSKCSFNVERATNLQALDMLVEPVLNNGFAFQPPPNNCPEQSIAFPIFIDGRYVASLLMIYMTRAMSSTMVVKDYAPHLQALAESIGKAAQAREEMDSESEITFPAFAAQIASNGHSRNFDRFS